MAMRERACTSTTAPTILLLGASGQVGVALRRYLAWLGKLATPGRAECDLARPSSLRDCVRALRPDMIVNAAAWTDVESAERQPVQAMSVNGDAVALLAHEATSLNALLVQYSSDYVFDGQLGRPYTETDVPNPLNAYGYSKLAGEQAACQSPRHLILRTSWVYSTHGNNFLKTMLALMGRRDRIDVVADQLGAPTGADLIARVTTRLLARYMRQHTSPPGGDNTLETFPFGLYHVAASGQASWYSYACLIAEQTRSVGGTLALPDDGILPIASSDWPTQVLRPADSRLNTTRLCDTFGLTLPPWHNGVKRTAARLIQGAHLCIS